MLTSSLEQLKELNKNKDECKKCTKSYIIINPVIPIKSGNDITKKVKSIYNNFLGVKVAMVLRLQDGDSRPRHCS